MRKLLLILVLCAFVTLSHASNVQEEFQQKTLQVLSVVEESESKTLTVLIDEPSWAEVGSNQELRVAEFPGEGFNDIPGQPVIPVIGRMVRIPVTGGAHIEILDTHFRIMSDVNYATFFGEGQESELEGSDPAVDRWYPEEIVSIDNPSIFKDFRVANISTYPIQVNTARIQFRVYDQLQYRIVYDESTNENSLDSWPVALSETFLPFYKQLLDWSDSELDQYELYRGGVQLVCPQDWVENMRDWIIWKKQKGWDVQLLTDSDVSWNSLSIHSELQDRYNASETKFDHIVIVGDATGPISTPHGSGGGFHGAGDHDYGMLAGTDVLLDASVGRISVSTESMLYAYINKVLAYEKETFTSNNPEDYEWYKRGSVAAGSSASGISTIFVARYARQVMLADGFTQVDTAFYNDGQGPVNSRIISQLNNGVSFHLYRGYLGSGIGDEDILTLNNSFKLPVVIDITCARGDWADGTSISETYMRAGNANNPKGAIAAMSTATINTHTRFNNSLAGGAAEAVFVHKVPTIGQMLIGAKLNMWRNFHGFQNSYVDNFNQWLNLMGDPTIWMFTDIPDSTISFDIASEFELGTSGVELIVQDNDGPLENAWMTFYKSDDNEEVIARGVTDQNGYVFLNTPLQYPGTAVITCTAHNHKPVQQNISVLSPAERLGISGCNVIDDGTSGTNGNGNGIIEAGETIGLLFDLYNYGQSDQSDIIASATTSDENIISITGNPTMASLVSGSEESFALPILVEIDLDAPDDWTAVLNLTLEGSVGTYFDSFGIKICAPKLVFVESTGIVSPGQLGNVTFTIANVGNSDIGNTELTLVINDTYEEWITVNTENGTLGPIESGSTEITSTFSFEGSEMAFKGYLLSANIIAETAAGQIHEIPVKIQMGNGEWSDPQGPDEHGYFAYDNRDTGYIMCPAYQWVEIDPDEETPDFMGTELPLTDTGSNQDKSIAVDLPFDFTYYGETYNTITICSNGWIAMGDQEGMALQRNWVIPSPLGPSAMIAPFWDDRTNFAVEDGVFYHYNESEGKFIVEWNKLGDILGMNECTFEVILYEYEEDFPTPTGDNEFLLQYKEINPSTGAGSDVPYWTTGIENADQQNGLQLSYYNVSSDRTFPIESERSILISTRTSFRSGDVTGTVTLFDDETPIPGVIISSNVLGTSDTTDVDGNYTISIASGTCDIIFRKNGYVTVVVEGVEVDAGGSVTVDARMGRPEFSIDPDSLTFNLEEGQVESQSFEMTNTGDASLTYTLGLLGRDPSGSSYEIGDRIYDFDLGEEDESLLDIDSRNDTLWVLSRELNGFDSYIRTYDLEGNELHSYRLGFMQDALKLQVTDNILILGFPNDLRFYTISNHLTYDSTKVFPYISNGYDFAVDFENEKIYFSSAQNILEYNFDMQQQESHYFNNMSIYGLDVNPDDLDGFTLTLVAFSWSSGQSGYQVMRYNTSDQEQELMFINSPGMEEEPNGITLIGTNSNMNYLVGLLYPYNVSGISIYQYITRLPWLDLDHLSGTIEPDSSESANVIVNSSGISMGTYYGWVAVRHNAVGNWAYLPIILNIGTVDVEEETGIPEEWALEGVYPNPFNPDATVKFSLRENVAVNARLYNILGQQVAVLANRPMQAGQHTLTINGENLSSGVYFLKFNAGPLSSVQKVVLLK